MARRTAAVALLIVPAVGLGALGLAIVASAGARPGPPGLGAPHHFALRQAIAVVVGGVLGAVVVRVGIARVLRLAPALFVIALLATAAVFVPGVGVRAAGASRWLHLGPLSGSPAAFLIGATGLLMAAAWGGPPGAARGRGASRPPLALALALLAVLVLVAQPDFSAAAVALCVTFAALAGAGVAGRRLVPAAAVLLLALVLGASRFGYVGGRIHGFLSPQSDRRGHGFEVLALARAKANAATGAVGPGTGQRAPPPVVARERLRVRDRERGAGRRGRVGGRRRVGRRRARARRSPRDPPPETSAAAASRPPAPPRCSRLPRCTSRSAGAGSRSWA